MDSSWIDLHALWRIVLLGLVAGAGLPAVFAVGIRSLIPAGEDRPGGVVVAYACFAVVLAAVGYGIWLVVDGT